MKFFNYIIYNIFIILTLFIAQTTYAGSTIVCQGILKDFNGRPIEKVVKMNFSISNSSKIILWKIDRFVSLNEGFFHVTLGKLKPISQQIIQKENHLIISLINNKNNFVQITQKTITQNVICVDEIVQSCCDCDKTINKSTGLSEYADVIIEAWYSNANSNFDSFYGGTLANFPVKVSPEVVLGNNESFLSLPSGSYVTVGFTDNYILNAANQDDIFIREIGGSGEKAEIYVSSDSKNFILLGIAQDDKTTSLDLEDIKFNKPVEAIKIVGLDNKGGSPGFDIVSVKAITGSSGHSLRIISNGPGSGIIKSVPAGISCGVECFHSFPEGTEVKLFATPDSKSTFGGWSINQYKGKIDIDNNECMVLLNSNTVIYATFYLNCNNTNSINSITSKGNYYNELKDKP